MKPLLLLGFLALLPVALLAQRPAAAPPAAAGGDNLIALQFPNSPVTDILTTYEALTGKTLIRDANLAGPNLTITASRKLRKEDAVRLIESALLLNGYALIPVSPDTLKVVNNAGKPARSEGIPLLTNLSDLPTGNQVVSFYMPLQFISPADAVPVLTAQVTLHPYGAIVAVPTAQAVVVTEDSGTIRQLLHLKDLMDLPPAKVVNDYIQLHRADAEKVVEIVNKMIDNPTGKGATGSAPAGGGAASAGGGSSPLDGKLVAGQTQLIADPRTNRILIVTRPVNMEAIKALITQLDQSVDVMAPFTRQLKYVSASDLLPVLQNILAESKEDASGASAASATSSHSSQNSTPTQAQNYNNNNNSSGLNGGDQSSDLQSRLGNEPDDIPPRAVIIGKTRLIADNKTNSIIVIGPPESMDKVSSIIDKLDVRPRQVYLATVIGKLNLSNNSELSVDVLQNFANVSGNTGVATSSMNSTSLTSPRLDPRSLSTAGAFPFISGLSLYGAVGHTLSYYVRALESTGRFTVMSRPSIYTANNKKASINSGQQVPVPQSTLSSLDTSSVNNVAQQSTIEYKNVELLLEVIPLINSDKEVTLQISQQNDTLNGNTTIAGNTVPNIATDGLQTTITVPDKQTVMLGGLIEDQDQTDRTGVPVLKDIPFLGALFRSDTKNRSRSELVILIEPTVVFTDGDLADAQKAETARSTMGAASVTYATKPASVVNGKSTAVESLTH